MRIAGLLAPLFFALIAPGAGAQVATLVAGAGGASVALDPVRHRAYAASPNGVFVVEGTQRLATVTAGRNPKWIAVNPSTNRVYASNSDGTLSVIDGATLAVTSLAIGGAGPVVVNSATDTVAVLRLGTPSEVTLVNGATNTWFTVATGSTGPQRMALNDATNKLYVTSSGSGDLSVVDLSAPSNPATRIVIGPSIGPLAINARTNRIYVTSGTTLAGGSVTVIDGASNATQTIALPSGHGGVPISIAVNETTNRVYVGFQTGSLGYGNLAVIDGATNGVLAYIDTYNALDSLIADPTSSRVYGLSGQAMVVAIDGTAYAWSSLLPAGAMFGLGTQALAIDAAAQRLYAVGSGMSAIDAAHGYSIPPVNFQGMWWNAPAGSESGWGIDFAHQGDAVFGALFTYDANGNAQWFVLPRLDWNAGGEYAGQVFRVNGPSYTSATFDPSKVAPTAIGAAWLRSVDANNAQLMAVIDGRPFFKRLTRQVFGPLPTCGAGVGAGAPPNYTDLWWNSPAGSESGWGLFVTHQGDNAFAVWFTYDTDGRALWFVGNAARSGEAVFSGTFYRTTGAPYTTDPWPANRTVTNAVGSFTLAFSGANNGSFTYSVPGASGFKAITREVFATPATVCR
jgi:DNA-binding beta-propeller fold protein YncE